MKSWRRSCWTKSRCSTSITARILIAHTTKLEGYKQMPDGLVRVVGLKLK